MIDKKEIKIFSGSTGVDFTKKICEYLGVIQGDSEVITFSDGNTFVKIKETVRNQDVFLVQPIGLKPNDEFVEILFWMDAFKRASALSVTAIIPYFGYSKGDKKDEPRVSIRARVCAESIELAGADRVVTMDLHSPQIQGFFKKPVDHLIAMPVLAEYVKRLEIEDLVIVSPDAGYAKQARKFASYLDVPVAIGDKTRKGHDEKALVLDIIGNVEGKNVCITDDFTTSGGTLVDIAKGLKQRGARQIIACLSHLLLNDTGVQRIIDSPIESVISTDSIYNPSILKYPDTFKIISVAPLFAETVSRIYTRESVSPLFDKVPEKVINASFDL